MNPPPITDHNGCGQQSLSDLRRSASIARSAMGRARNWSRPCTAGLTLALILAATSPGIAQDDVQIFGNVSPSPATTPTWNVGSDLRIGSTAAGTLQISGTGAVSNTVGYIGLNSGSTGLATVSGGTWSNSSTLFVGSFGNGTLEISATGAVSNTAGVISNNSVSTSLVAVSGGTWTNSGELRVGNSGNGTLQISGTGAVSNTEGLIAHNRGSTGLATVSGGTWTNSGALRVGYFGNGTLKISGTGAVSNTEGHIGTGTNSTGLATVSGGTWTNSSSLYVANGTLEISGTGAVSNAAGSIGSSSGTSLGTVSGGTWSNSGELRVGNFGTGTLEISGTGAVSNTIGYIGFNSDANGLAIVSGGTWSNSGELTVGDRGNGTLEISGNGLVSNTIGAIGFATNSTGLATVSGGTWTNSRSLFVGNSGTGTLKISGTGAVTNTVGVIGNRSGSTGLATVSGGTWTNSGDLYVGGIGNGTLEISGTGAVSNTEGYIGWNSGSIDLATVSGGTWSNSGELQVGRSGTGTLAISGSGAVSSAVGVIGLNSGSTGLATVSGGTWINSEMLHVGYAGNGTLEISGTGSVSASSVVLTAFSGASSLNLLGGTLSTSQVSEGTGSLGGTVTFDGGTLRLTADQSDLFANFDAGDVTFIGSGGTIDTQNFTVGTSLALSGDGGLTKQGNGTLILSGNNTYSGGTNVGGGSLLVSGSLGSPAVTVQNSALLGGGGTLAGNVIILSGGILSPGNSTGILSIDGNLILNTGSTTRMEINGTTPGTGHDQIIVGGTASLAGTLELFFGGGLGDGDAFTLINTANPISGNFDSVVNMLGNALNFRTTVTDDYLLTLTAMQNDFLPFALTPNQQAVAAAIDALADSGDLDGLIDFLNTLPGDSLASAFDQIAPTSMAFISDVVFANTRFRQRDLSGHMSQRRNDFSRPEIVRGDVPSSAKHSSQSAPADDDRWGFFASGNFAHMDHDRSGTGSGYDSKSGGPMLGVDYLLSDSTIVGVYTGYDRTNLDFGDNGGDVRGDSAAFGLYGTWFHQSGSWLEGALGGGYHRFRTTRNVFGADASGRTHADEFLANLTFGHDLQLGHRQQWKLTPSVGLAYNRLAIDGFTETGSLAPLTLEDQTAESLRSEIGLQLSCRHEWAGVAWMPYVNGSWQHEFLDVSQSVNARFAAGGGLFTVNGPSNSRNTVTFGTGINALFSESLSAGLGYSGEVNSDYQIHQISAILRLRF